MQISSFLIAMMTSAVIAEVQAQTSPPGLGGTSWQLVRIQSMDDKVVAPDDRSKYTIAFGTDGRVNMRIDCNRGSGTWKSPEPNQLVFGPMAVTRAMCPPGSLHDRVVKDMEYIRSYTIKEDHLFLSLMADGGIYEFEPLPKAASGAKYEGPNLMFWEHQGEGPGHLDGCRAHMQGAEVKAELRRSRASYLATDTNVGSSKALCASVSRRSTVAD
jgi:heat shock protein HslJ